jgi:hypothetical protein
VEERLCMMGETYALLLPFSPSIEILASDWPSHCTSGAPVCSEIPYCSAWSRKGSSFCALPFRGTAGSLVEERLCMMGETYTLLLSFSPSIERLASGWLAHCTSGAPVCSEIPYCSAWRRKVSQFLCTTT